MTLLYKLTDHNHETRNGTRWGPGISHSGTGKGDLCSEGYIHAYLSPELALFLNPIHAEFENPRLYEAEGEIAINDRDLKVGCVTLTTILEIPFTPPTPDECVTFAILCAKEVCRDPEWTKWADRWLSGEDRSTESADAAASAASAAYDAAYYAASAAYFAYFAASAARAASAAAYAANKSIDLVALARKAMGAHETPISGAAK